MSVSCPDYGAITSYGHEIGHKSDCPSLRGPTRLTTLGETLQAIAASLDEVLNGDAKGNECKVGFVLLTFPFGELGTDRLHRVNYVGNGERSDVYAALKELIARWDGNVTSNPPKPH